MKNHAARPTTLETLEPRLLLSTTAYSFTANGALNVYNGHDLYIEVPLAVTTDNGTGDSFIAKFDRITNLSTGIDTTDITATSGTGLDNVDNHTYTVLSGWGVNPAHFAVGQVVSFLWQATSGKFYVRIHTDGAASLNGQTFRLQWRSETLTSHIYKTGADGNYFDFTVVAAPGAASPTFGSPTAVPALPNWEEDMQNYGRYMFNPNGTDNTIDLASGTVRGPEYVRDADWTLTGGNSSEVAKFGTWYYDGVRTAYQMMDYTGSDAWQGAAETTLITYRDHYVSWTGGVPSIKGFRAYGKGLLYDFQRTGNPADLAALQTVSQDFSYSTTGGSVRVEMARETAYALDCYIADYQAEGYWNPKMTQSLDMLLGQIDQEFVSKNFLSYDPAGSGADFIQPFFTALQCEALATYYRDVNADPAILDAIAKAANWLWANDWIPNIQPNIPTTDRTYMCMPLLMTQPYSAYQGTTEAEGFTLDPTLTTETRSGGSGGSDIRLAAGQTTGSATLVTTGSSNPYRIQVRYYDTAGATSTLTVQQVSGGVTTTVGTISMNNSTSGFYTAIVSTTGATFAPGDTLKLVLNASGADMCAVDRVDFIPAPAAGLSNLVSYIYGFLYNTYGDTADNWAAKGDALFQTGATMGDVGTAEWYMNQNGKCFNENYRLSFDYVQFREDHVYTSGNSTAPVISSVTSTVSSAPKPGTPEWSVTQQAGSSTDFITGGSGYVPADRNPSEIVSWTTDKPCRTELQYGQLDAAGNVQYTNVAKPGDPDLSVAQGDYAENWLTTNHSMVVKGLSAGEYHFRVKATDSNGNVTYSGDNVFTMTASDATLPAIMNPRISGHSSYAYLVDWDNNDDSTATMELYDDTGAKVFNWSNYLAGRSFEHECWQTTAEAGTAAVPTLSTSKVYSLKIITTDRAGNTTASPMLHFKDAADTTAPTVSLLSPLANAQLSGMASVSANVSDNIGVFGTSYTLDGNALGQTLGDGAQSFAFDTTDYSYGPHALYVTAKDDNYAGTAPNATTKSVSINVVPSLSLVALDASANRQTNDPGVFRLYRQNVNGAVTVNYTTSGSAVNGSDYNTLAGSVTFAVGEAYKDIVITPAGSSGASQTATLTLTSSSAYNIDAASATVTIAGAGLGGDANGDGTVNFKDYIVLEGNFGKTSATWAMGDFDANGTVNFKDYIILEGNFGKSAPAPAPAVQMISATLSSVSGPLALPSPGAPVLGRSAQRTALRTVTWAKPQKWQFPPVKGLADAAMIDVLAAAMAL